MVQNVIKNELTLRFQNKYKHQVSTSLRNLHAKFEISLLIALVLRHKILQFYDVFYFTKKILAKVFKI